MGCRSLPFTCHLHQYRLSSAGTSYRVVGRMVAPRSGRWEPVWYLPRPRQLTRSRPSAAGSSGLWLPSRHMVGVVHMAQTTPSSQSVLRRGNRTARLSQFDHQREGLVKVEAPASSTNKQLLVGPTSRAIPFAKGTCRGDQAIVHSISHSGSLGGFSNEGESDTNRSDETRLGPTS